ncbi:MAG: DUF4435 domain-containing protein [Duncaniella sp.]|nr:DUF4435 domain-containing protein [Duncaniella sp.]
MNRIEDQANYYKNLPLRYRNIKGVVHIEDKDDKEFWNNQLQNISPGYYHFVAHSRSENGNDTSGCEQCMRYLPYINRKFFICIDSDLRLLRHEENLTSENYVAQTYAYSWESHYCEASHLQERYFAATGENDFDFVLFTRRLSEIVYRPLLILIRSNTPGLSKDWNITKFNSCIPLQPSRAEMAGNGEGYLMKVAHLFETALLEVDTADMTDVEGITPKNAYLHIQGHRLYDLIMHIGTLICRGKNVPFKSRILDTACHYSGYTEINNVQSDLNTILS